MLTPDSDRPTEEASTSVDGMPRPLVCPPEPGEHGLAEGETRLTFLAQRSEADEPRESPSDPAHPLLVEAADDDPLFADLPEGETLVTFIASPEKPAT